MFMWRNVSVRVRFKVTTAEWLRIEVVHDVILFQWISGSRCFDGSVLLQDLQEPPIQQHAEASQHLNPLTCVCLVEYPYQHIKQVT
jgi:hypothetical protein